jgi:hypothetical protein
MITGSMIDCFVWLLGVEAMLDYAEEIDYE